MAGRMTRAELATEVRKARAALDMLTAGHAGLPRFGTTVTGSDERQLMKLDAAVRAMAQGLQAPHVAPELTSAVDTTREALALVLPKAGSQRARVLDRLATWAGPWPLLPIHGLTDVQLARMTGLAPNTVRPRRGELVTAGLVMDSGHRRKHEGREHIVWTLTEAARHTVGVTTTDDDGTPP